METWLVVAMVWGCGGESTSDTGENAPEETAALGAPFTDDQLESLDPLLLQAHVDVLADEGMAGRIPGSHGHALSYAYIEAEMASIGLTPMGDGGGFTQSYSNDAVSGRLMLTEEGEVVAHETTEGVNLLGVVPGHDPILADEYIVVMAHYDHLGVNATGDAYNGAFDNATGVSLGLELARLFMDSDFAPGRSILFFFTDDEESGFDGSLAWLDEPTVPLAQVVAGISVDPVGRPMLPDYWPLTLLGAERSEAFDLAWRTASEWADPELDVVFVHREIIPSYLLGSDHDSFYEHETPLTALWFVNPGMSFYHTVNDTPETVDYRVLLSSGKFLAQTLGLLSTSDASFTYAGSPEMDWTHAEDVLPLLYGVEGSNELTADEREELEGYIAEVESVVESQDIDVLDNRESFFIQAGYFLLFDLPVAHPGEVPPPFPE